MKNKTYDILKTIYRYILPATSLLLIILQMVTEFSDFLPAKIITVITVTLIPILRKVLSVAQGKYYKEANEIIKELAK